MEASAPRLTSARSPFSFLSAQHNQISAQFEIDRDIQEFCDAVRASPTLPTVPLGTTFPDLSAASDPSLSMLADVIVDLFVRGKGRQRSDILALIRAQSTQRFVKSLLARDFFKIAFTTWTRKGGVWLMDWICGMFVSFQFTIKLVYSEPTMLDALWACVQSTNKRPVEEKQSALRAIAFCAGAAMPAELRPRALGIAREVFDHGPIKFCIEVVTIPRCLMTDAEWSRHILTDLAFFTDFSRLLQSENNWLLKNALWTFGQYFLYCEEVLELDLTLIMAPARSSDIETASAALWLISNMIMASGTMISTFVALGLFEVIAAVRSEGSFMANAAAFPVLDAIVKRGNDAEIMALVEACSCIQMFVEMSEMENIKITERALAALARILRLADLQAREICIAKFIEADGPAVIANLAESGISDEIVAVATKMLGLVATCD
jgi:hypothetical protein